MIYGYARCSTNEERQDIDRQKRELYSLGVTEDKYIYWEYESGTNNERVEFNKLLDLMEKGDTLCIIEAMKLMNEIESEFDGEVVEILVKDEEMVEYGKPLFVIK